MLSHLGAWHAMAAHRGDGFPPEFVHLLQRPVAAVSSVYRTISDGAEQGRRAHPGSDVGESGTRKDPVPSKSK
jgi:hypothetical protein